MTDKSHVAIGINACPICGMQEETGSILLDTRLHNSLDKYELESKEPCTKCTDLHEKGYVALIGPECVVHVRRELLEDPPEWAAKISQETVNFLEVQQAGG